MPNHGFVLETSICPGHFCQQSLFNLKGKKEQKSAPGSLSAHPALHPFDAAFNQHSP
jgi:hypothetical protein